MFIEFSGNLCEKRWFAVYHFVARSHPLTKVLRNKWDVQAYLEGFSRDKADEDQDRLFNPRQVGTVLARPC
eukprot:10026930-Lingulodinium_polyedra.AAC.1